MSSCPICATPLTASVCSACGYDPSRDYKRFPTYAPIPATKTEFLHCIRCGGIQFGLRSGDERPVCLSCGLPRPAVEMPPVALAAHHSVFLRPDGSAAAVGVMCPAGPT